MTKDTGKLSCQRYLRRNSEMFRLISFYNYFNFETRQSAEVSLKRAVSMLKAQPKDHKRSLKDLLVMLSADDYKYLDNVVFEVYWCKLEAQHTRLKTMYEQIIVESETGSDLLHNVRMKHAARETAPSQKV